MDSHTRIIPAQNLTSEKGISLALTLIKPEEEAQFWWPKVTKFIFELSEFKPPFSTYEERILQFFIMVEGKGIAPKLLERLNLWFHWSIGPEEERVVFKRIPEEDNEYVWGIWECPLLC